MAQALAAHSGARLALIADNVANADTPKFRARDLPRFNEQYDDFASFALRRDGRDHFEKDQSPFNGSVYSGGAMAPNGNDVSLDLMMARSVEVRQDHEMALAVYRSASAVLRTSLGRMG
ncbi:FlgB family protein [Thioclava sp. FR2]|uniref:FlgB family protein n=1 Tax=Thioclava sp. FR2 TaxID=3445780 RepID=UPI003EB8E3BD